jgi:hypothetical protein
LVAVVDVAVVKLAPSAVAVIKEVGGTNEMVGIIIGLAIDRGSEAFLSVWRSSRRSGCQGSLSRRLMIAISSSSSSNADERCLERS